MIILGLGSNLGDRINHINTAITKLNQYVSITNLSSIYQSDALMLPNSPPEWNIKFLNMAISIKTSIAPHELLALCKEIESQIGHNNLQRWAPRQIDIDILTYNDLYLNEDNLTIPHKDLAIRDFAIIPLAEIAPYWQHPILKKIAKEIATNITNSNHVQLWSK